MAAVNDPNHLLVSPRGDRTGEVLKLDVALQVQVSPVMVLLRDQALRRGPAGLLHLADASGVKAAAPPVFVEPERYLNALRDDGHRIGKEDAQALQAAFCDARGYKNVTLFIERVIAIFHGARRARAEKVFEILAENAAATAASSSSSAQRFAASSATAPLAKRLVVLSRRPAERTSWDACIPCDARPYSLLTFLCLMAGVSVVIESDDAFDAVLRSFDVAVTQTTAASSNGGSNVAAFLEGEEQEQQFKKTVPRGDSNGAGGSSSAGAKKYIAGCMLHISGAAEHFGHTHYETMRKLPDLTLKRGDTLGDGERALAAAPRMMEIKYRGGNKSNFHNFALS